MHYSTRAFVTINGKMVGIPLQVDKTTAVTDVDNPTMAQRFKAEFERQINARTDMDADQKAQAIAEFTDGDVKKLIEAHLEVDFEGSVFIHSQLGANPNGQIRLSSLTEATGAHEQAPGQMLVVTEQMLNALREQHPDMTVDEAMNNCPIEWGGKQYGSLREFLGLLADQGLAIEGYDRFGRRFPMSKLGKMTLRQLGLNDLTFKIFDPHFNPHIRTGSIKLTQDARDSANNLFKSLDADQRKDMSCSDIFFYHRIRNFENDCKIDHEKDFVRIDTHEKLWRKDPNMNPNSPNYKKTDKFLVSPGGGWSLNANYDEISNFGGDYYVITSIPPELRIAYDPNPEFGQPSHCIIEPRQEMTLTQYLDFLAMVEIQRVE